MAYLRRVRIKDYRSIRDCDIDLTPEEGQRFRHLIFTGPNGSGKTSALELIERWTYAFCSGRNEPRGQGLPLLVEFDEPHAACFKKFDNGKLILVRFKAQRLLEVLATSGSMKLDWGDAIDSLQGTSSNRILQYLVNRKTDQAFALAEGDQKGASEIENWFSQLEHNLRRIFEDPGLTLQFERKQYTFLVQYSDGRTVSFEQLADGHSAALAVFFEIFVRYEARRTVRQIPPERIEGIVFIDEVETHLHLRLQELILPFLTELFPTIQFVVATHSPAVIASVPNAMVYDLGTREALASEDMQGVRYGTIMTHHFGIAADMDRDSTDKLARLRELARASSRDAEDERELQELVELLDARSPTLKLEVWKALNPARAPKARGAGS